MVIKFTLQPVLDFRQTRVEILEIELGYLTRKCNECLKALADLRVAHSHFQLLLREKQGGDIDVPSLSILRNSIKYIQKRIEDQESRLIDMEQRVKVKQLELANAKKDQEVLETLKEKAEQRFLEVQTKEENRLLDDIYNAQAYRKAKRNAA
jgi:flagellar FliJ protein